MTVLEHLAVLLDEGRRISLEVPLDVVDITCEVLNAVRNGTVFGIMQHFVYFMRNEHPRLHDSFDVRLLHVPKPLRFAVLIDTYGYIVQ